LENSFPGGRGDILLHAIRGSNIKRLRKIVENMEEKGEGEVKYRKY
jgi:hypothetical protein